MLEDWEVGGRVCLLQIEVFLWMGKKGCGERRERV